MWVFFELLPNVELGGIPRSEDTENRVSAADNFAVRTRYNKKFQQSILTPSVGMGFTLERPVC